MLASALIVVVVAQPPGGPLLDAFTQTAQRALGASSQLQLEVSAEDPADELSAARAADVDGLVELSLSRDGNQAHLHCYVSREKRWADRDIKFSSDNAASPREQRERGRLLGFAVATMFAASAPSDEAEAKPPSPNPEPKPEIAGPPTRTPTMPAEPRPSPEHSSSSPAWRSRSLDFRLHASSGIRGTAAGFGATGVLRQHWYGPLWARGMIAAREGSIPAAQATTRTLLGGGGIEFSVLPKQSRFQLGLRGDAFAVYFSAEHLSEDDVVPAHRRRWLAGFNWGADVGFKLTDTIGLVAGAGIEALTGKTEVFTHGIRVATVPALRVVAEGGLRAHF